MQCLAPALFVTMRNDRIEQSQLSNTSTSKYVNAKNVDYEQSLLAPAIEDRFFKLVAAGKKYGYDTDAIIEKPNMLGSTAFETASLFSDKICQYILNRNIRVNNILPNFVYPIFPGNLEAPNCEKMNKKIYMIWEKMLKKGINPKVITGRVLTNQALTFYSELSQTLK